MPRSTKESSDDENDVKSGRRTKTLAGGLSAVTDSPLRRSTRNKPTISPTETAGDTSDGSSTVSAASSIQSGRNTRRRTITTIPESTTTLDSLPIRSLRSRKTSTTSTTSLDNLSVDPVVLITDCESQKDVAKPRFTRKSTSAASSTIDTPPATRLRRFMRAGSESKTMSPSTTVRITRRTRASSVDLDEQRDEVKPISCNIKDSNQHSTPVKTRKRASVLPSEPSVVEETENVSQNNGLPLSSTSIIETVDNKTVAENNDNMNQQQEQEIQLDTLQENSNNNNKSTENDNNDNNNNNNNNNNSHNSDNNNDDDNAFDNSNHVTVNQTKSSSPVLKLRMSIDESKESDQEMSIANEEEKLSSSVVKEIQSPVKTNSSLIACETTAVMNNDDDNNSVNIKLLSPKVSTVMNSSISIKSPIAETKNSSLVDKINESLEKSPGNKENVEPLSSTNIRRDNSESVISASPDFKLTTHESINDSVLITSVDNYCGDDDRVTEQSTKSLLNENSEVITTSTTNTVTTSTANFNNSFNFDKTQQPNDLNSSHSTNQQKQSISEESTDKENNDLINNSSSESVTEDKIENVKTPPTIPTSSETPADITDESGNKDNTDMASTPSSPNNNSNVSQHDDCTKSNKLTSPSSTATLELREKMTDNEECNVENENVDIENLFHDIPADEWNANTEEVKSETEIKTKEVIPEIVVSDNNITNNDDQENIEQLQDIDCNTDSNDTIIVTQCDDQSLKYTKNQYEFSKTQESMDIGSDDDNETEIEPDLVENNINSSLSGSSKKKKQRLSNSGKKSKNKSFNNEEDNENKSDSLSTSLLNKSNSINLSDNCSLNPKKGDNSTVSEELSSPLKLRTNKSNVVENKNLLRKSIDSAKLIMHDEKNKASTNNKKKLNASMNSKLNLSTDSTEQSNTNCNDNNISVSKSEINDDKKKSLTPSPLNISNKQNSPLVSLRNKQQELSDDQSDLLSSDDKLNKSNKINSDSENNDKDDYDDVDDDDEFDNDSCKNNKSKITAPSLLLNYESSSNSDDSCSSENDNSDMDSDIAREYNFNGVSVSEYSDDNEVGDECRESETEHSDEDDDGEDLADFIADDDDDDDKEEEDVTSMSSWFNVDIIGTTITKNKEESAEEEEDEDDSDDDNDGEVISSQVEKDENIKSKKEEKQEENSSNDEDDSDEDGNDDDDDDNDDDDDDNNEDNEEENYKNGLHKVQKHLKFDFNNTCNENDDYKKGGISDSSKLLIKSSKTSIKFPRNSIDKLSTIKAKSCNSTPINTKIDSQVSKSADTKIEKRKYKKIESGSENELNSFESLKKSKSWNSTSPSVVHHNKSMELLNVTDHDEILLMKEKLNETLPSLKLQPIDNKSPSKKNRSKNNENNKENSVELNKESNVSKSKKNKNLDSKTMAMNQLEKSSEKRKVKKKSASETDSTEIEFQHKSKKSKTAKTLDDHELTSTPPKKLNKKKKKEKKENLLKIQSNAKNASSIPSVNKSLKRLPDEVIDKLSDSQPQKKRKLSSIATEKILPSRTMFDAKHPKPPNMIIETETEFIPLSSNGGTTSFSVVNINKTSKQQTKKSAAAFSFRQRILGRNPRQPISAYLMYQQKLKASSRDKY